MDVIDRNSNKEKETDTYRSLISQKLSDTIGLFTHRHTTNLYNRQISSIQKIIRYHDEANQGFRILDLIYTCELIHQCLERVNEGNTLFIESLSKLLRLHGLPFIQDHSYQASQQIKLICQVVKQIAQCLFCCRLSIQIMAAQTLSSMVSSSSSMDNTFMDPHIYVDVMIESNVISSLVQSLQKAESSIPSTPSSPSTRKKQNEICLYLKCQAIRDICQLSSSVHHSGSSQSISSPLDTTDTPLNVTIWSQLRSTPLCYIVPHLLQTSFNDQIVNVLLDTLWYLVENDPFSAIELIDRGLLPSIYDLLNSLMLNGHRLQDMDIRNSILVLLILLASYYPTSPEFINSGLLDLILYYCCDRYSNQYSSFILKGSDINLEMKQLMWAFIDILRFNPRCLSRIAQSGVLGSLISLINSSITTNTTTEPLSNDNSKSIHSRYPINHTPPSLPRMNYHWSSFQKRSLTLHSLCVLDHFIPLIPLHYQQYSADEKILSYCLLTVDDEVLCSMTFKCLLRECWSESRDQLYHEKNLHQIIQIISDVNRSISLRTDFLSLLSLALKNSPKNQKIFRRIEGIHILKNLCSISNVRDSRFLLSVVDCIWNGIVGNTLNENLFLVLDGLDSLLDLCVECPCLMRKQILSCLSDLLLNQKALPYFSEWICDKTNENAVIYLLNLWNEAENMQKTKYKNQNQTDDIDISHLHNCSSETGDNDINSHISDAQLIQAVQDGFISSRVDPLMEYIIPENVIYKVFNHDLRHTLYAVLSHAGLTSQETTLIEEDTSLQPVYCRFGLKSVDETTELPLGDQFDLSPSQRAALSVVQKWPQVTKGQAWKSIKQDLEIEGIRPLSPEYKEMIAHIGEADNRVKAMEKAQMDTKAKKAKEEEEYLLQYIENKKKVNEIEQDILPVKKPGQTMTKTHREARKKLELKKAKEQRGDMIKKGLVLDQTFLKITGEIPDYLLQSEFKVNNSVLNHPQSSISSLSLEFDEKIEENEDEEF